MASKKEVEAINTKRLAELEEANQSYVSFDEPGQDSRGYALGPKEAKEVLDRGTRWSEVVDLKVGALVMLLVNMQVSRTRLGWVKVSVGTAYNNRIELEKWDFRIEDRQVDLD